jgi:hypothetical protein
MLEILRSLLFSFFAVAVLLPVVRYAMRRLLVGGTDTPLTADELKYIQKKEWKLVLTYFFFATVISVFSAGILALLSSIIHSSSKDFLYLLTPNLRALFAPGLMIGLTLAVLPLRLVQETLMGHDYSLYKNYLLQTEGKRSISIYRILFLAMLLLSAILTWFALKWHVSIGEDQITVTNLLSEERTYTMAQINKIEYLGKEGEYIITFADNTNINTTYLKPVQLEMIAFLSEKSGKKVIR